MQVEKAIRSRKSVRKFKTKKPDWRDILEAIDSAKYAPMAGNNFTLKFILVDDPEKIQRISDAAQQPFIAQAKYIVVVCSNPERTETLYGKKGGDYNQQQVGAAIENFLLTLTNKGLASCWIGYFCEDIIRFELKIPEKIKIDAVFPIGYESDIKYTRRAKTDLDNFLYFNKYKNKKMKAPGRVE